MMKNAENSVLNQHNFVTGFRLIVVNFQLLSNFPSCQDEKYCHTRLN